MRGGISKPSLFAFQDIITSVIGVFVLITILLVLGNSIDTDGSDSAQRRAAASLSAASARLENCKIESAELARRLESALETAAAARVIKDSLSAKSAEVEALERGVKIVRNVLAGKIPPSALDEVLRGRMALLKSDTKRKNAEIAKVKTVLSDVRFKTDELNRLAEEYRGAAVISGSGDVGGRRAVYVDCSDGMFTVLGKSGKKDFTALCNYLSGLDSAFVHVQFIVRPSASAAFGKLTEFCESLKIPFGSTAVLDMERIVDARR